MPINVTDSDHANERRLAKVFAEYMPEVVSLDVEGFQTNLVNPVDGLITLADGQTAWAEIRCRERYAISQLEKWGPYINMHKLWNIVHDSRGRDKTCVFIVFGSDGFLVYNLYNRGSGQALDGQCRVSYTNPKRKEERGQAVNDSCFAAYLWNPVKKVTYKEQ